VTKARKKEILDSRVQSINLLFDVLKKGNHRVKSFVSASAIGFYGPGDELQLFTETSPVGTDFLAGVTKQWEDASEKINSLGIRVVKIRTGMVLSKSGGVLKSMAAPIRLGLGSVLGSGKQYLSWIHIDDLCSIYIKAIEDPLMRGTYNAVAGEPVTNREFTRIIARAVRKPLWLPAIPSFVLKLVLGEMATLVITGSKVSSEKIRQAGYSFRFTDLERALRELLT